VPNECSPPLLDVSNFRSLALLGMTNREELPRGLQFFS
jgi:hypothetical protein